MAACLRTAALRATPLDAAALGATGARSWRARWAHARRHRSSTPLLDTSVSPDPARHSAVTNAVPSTRTAQTQTHPSRETGTGSPRLQHCQAQFIPKSERAQNRLDSALSVDRSAVHLAPRFSADSALSGAAEQTPSERKTETGHSGRDSGKGSGKDRDRLHGPG